jgi:hypothetical protein
MAQPNWLRIEVEKVIVSINELPTWMTTVWVRTYDGTDAVPTTDPCRTYDVTLPCTVSRLSIFEQRIDNSQGTDPERREGQNSL